MGMPARTSRRTHGTATLGGRLAAARRAANLTQDELGDRVGRSRRTVAEYEGGEDAPLSIVLAWADATGADLLYLATGARTPDAATHRIQRLTRDSTLRDARSGRVLTAPRAA